MHTVSVGHREQRGRGPKRCSRRRREKRRREKEKEKEIGEKGGYNEITIKMMPKRVQERNPQETDERDEESPPHLTEGGGRANLLANGRLQMR